MKKTPPDQIILKLIKERAVCKQEVYEVTKNVFNELKQSVSEIANDLKSKFEKTEKTVIIETDERSEYQANLRIGEDVLLYVMHSNIFTFDRDHHLWKTSYFQENHLRSYCGIIYVYNFLHDSFRYNRTTDMGYVIARIFVNKDRHFFVEGKRQLGVLYNDFTGSVAGKVILKDVIQSTIIYALDFDTFVPPYEEVKEISVQEMQEITLNMRIKTAKRMGFQFSIDETKMEG